MTDLIISGWVMPFPEIWFGQILHKWLWRPFSKILAFNFYLLQLLFFEFCHIGQSSFVAVLVYVKPILPQFSGNSEGDNFL